MAELLLRGDRSKLVPESIAETGRSLPVKSTLHRLN